LPRKRRATLRGLLAILSSRSALGQQYHLDRVLAAARAWRIEVVAARIGISGALLAALALRIGALHSLCDVTGPTPICAWHRGVGREMVETRQRRIPNMGRDGTTIYYILTRVKFIRVNFSPSNSALMIVETLAPAF
jgi:hypothetical protein